MDFGGPDPRKWSSRLSETLIFKESLFSFLDQFCLDFLGPGAPKWYRKGSKKLQKNNCFPLTKTHRIFPQKGVPGDQNWCPLGCGRSRAMGVNPPKMYPKSTKWTKAPFLTAVFSKIGSMFFIILLVGLSLDASFIRFCFLLVVLIRLFLFFVVASSSFGCWVGDVPLCCFVDFSCIG